MKRLLVILSLLSVLLSSVAVAAPAATIIQLKRDERGFILEAGDGQAHQSEVGIVRAGGKSEVVSLTWQPYGPGDPGSWAQLPYLDLINVGPIQNDGTSIGTNVPGWSDDSSSRTFYKHYSWNRPLFLPQLSR